MSSIDEYYNRLWNTPSDINEHFPVIKKYAGKSDVVYELGVRSIVSTWALLAGRPKEMTSVDIYAPSYYGGRLENVINACTDEGIKFQFILASSLEISLKTDLLFIDTIHTYSQLSQELKLHGKWTNQYILLHDTESCKVELQPAIEEFLKENPKWMIKEIYTNNNGLTVLEKV
jgi:hypothetical protein